MDTSVSAAAHLRERFGERRPEVLLTLGSGLAAVAEDLDDAEEVEVDDVPGLVGSLVPGHASRLRCGRLGGAPCSPSWGAPTSTRGTTSAP